MHMRELYFDINDMARGGRGGARMIAIIGGAGERVRPCGLKMYVMPAGDRERAYDIARDCLGIEFLFEDAPARAPFYPAPMMTAFARDRAGGWFCTLGECADMQSGAAVYYVDAARRCRYIARSLRALMAAAALDAGFMRRAGCAGGACELSYADQQYMIDKLGLRACDAANIGEVRPAPEARVYLCRELAERELEFIRPGMGARR